jgi:hypothetical protein
MDTTLIATIREILKEINIGVTSIGDTLWLKDEKIQHGNRWVLLDYNNNEISIKNGRRTTKVTLSHPNSLKVLISEVNTAMCDTKLFYDLDI